MPSVAIVYGFAEGPAHAARLRRALQQQGFKVVTSLNGADYIIAHSGGILGLPTDLARGLRPPDNLGSKSSGGGTAQ